MSKPCGLLVYLWTIQMCALLRKRFRDSVIPVSISVVLGHEFH